MTGRNQMCTSAGCIGRTVARRLCRKHYQAAWKAGELGEHTKLPPRPSARPRCPAEHKHAGSSTCYIQHKCRCDECCAHHSWMETRRNKLKAYGRYDSGLVDVKPVREHMMMLGEFGIGYKRVAHLAGIGATAARTILWGRQDPGPRNGELQKRVKRETAEAILAVRPDIDSLAGGAMIPARGAHRRVQALVARGWSQAKIAERIGMNGSNFTSFMQRDLIMVANHRAIAEVFERLWNVEPPHDTWRDRIAFSRSLHYAAERRWLPPLAWDDIDNDPNPPVPDEEANGVDEIAVELALAGEGVRLSAAERREAVKRGHSRRWSDPLIASRLHVNVRTVARIRDELELEAHPFDDLVKRGEAA